jgi:hypothetical protein
LLLWPQSRQGMNLPGAHTDAIPPVESDQSGDRIVQPAALGTPAASSLMSLARPAEDLRRTFYHLRTTDANAQAATDENRHHAQMAHEVADRREQIREIADEGKRHWYVAIPIATIWHSDDSHGIQIET